MLAIAAMVAFSCSKEVEQKEEKTLNEPEKVFVPKVISAFTDDDVTPDTKTSLSGVNILWASTDNIKGYDGKDVHTSTSTAVSNGGKKADFTFATVSVENDLYTIAYPAENVTDIDEDYVYATIPSIQIATAGSFANGANVAVADGLTPNPVFKNVGGLLSIIINNDDITSVKLSANEELTGSSIISIGSGDFADAVIDEGVESVTLSGTIDNGSEYYAVVYPGTYTGLKIEVTNASGQVATFTNSTPLTVERNANLHIATLTIPAGKWVTPTKGSEYIWTLASGDLGSNGSPLTTISGKGTPAKNWSAIYSFADATKYIGWENARGVQFGSGSHGCSGATFSTTEYTENIQSVAVNAAATGTGNIAVSVNGVSLKYSSETSQALTSSATEYVFMADALIKGSVEVIFSGGNKAFYLKSIKINPDVRTAQTLSFPQAAYSAELTEGSFTSPTLSGASTTVTYSSDNTDVATVNSSTGLVTLVAIGTANITATAAENEDYKEGSASYTLTVTSGPTSIAEVISASKDDDVYTTGVVAQVNAKGFVMTDGTDNILVYQNATPSVIVGQVVKVSGTRGAYNNVPQIGSPIVTEGITGQEVVRTSKTTITSANCSGLTYSSYVNLSGPFTISGSYYNIAIDESTVKGSLYQVVPATTYSGATLANMDGGMVNVTGYVTGSSASYLYIAPVDVSYLKHSTPDSAGYADNSTATITVSSNCEWTAAKGTDNDGIIKSITYDATTITVTFNANAGAAKSAQVIITPSALSGVPAVNVTVNQIAYGGSLVPSNETFTFSTLGYSNQQGVSSIAGTNLDISFTDGSNPTAYFNTGTGIRIYGEGSFTIAAKDNHKIKSISCTYSAAGYAPNSDSLNANYASLSTTGSTSTGTLTYGASSVWTCASEDPASSVTITRNSGSGHWRLQAITVSFAN